MGRRTHAGAITVAATAFEDDTSITRHAVVNRRIAVFRESGRSSMMERTGPALGVLGPE